VSVEKINLVLEGREGVADQVVIEMKDGGCQPV